MTIDLSQFGGDCACGRQHQIVLEGVYLQPGALALLPQLIRRLGSCCPVVICDGNTYQAAGQQAAGLADNCPVVLLDSLHLHADEHGVAAALAQLPAAADLLLAVGSGTVHDITRYIAAQQKLDFISVPTAASVDGFASTVAAMTWKGCKMTFPAVSPRFIVADSNVFAAAPYRLTAAGIGDLLGKYISVADWELSHLLTGEYLCPRVCQLEREAVDHVVGALEEIRAGSVQGCEALMYGLILSGIAMQMVGNSRPASGSEHHISHLWEMGVLHPAPDALHGEKVGVGTLLALETYKQLLSLLTQGRLVQQPFAPATPDQLGQYFTDPGQLEEILQMNTPDALSDIPAGAIAAHAGQIAQILEALPDHKAFASMMEKAGCLTTPQALGLPSRIVADTLNLSPYVRNRLTLMRMRRILQ